MWKTNISALILFYFLAVMQNSFFAHYSFYGAEVNFVFIIFFILIFFTDKKNIFDLIFLALVSGIILDIYSNYFFGAITISFLVVSYFIKKVQSLLREKGKNDFPFIYFFPIFLVSFILQRLITTIISLNYMHVLALFDLTNLLELVYNLSVASFIYYIIRKIFFREDHDRKVRFY